MLLRPQGLLGTVEWGFLRAPWVPARTRTDSTVVTPPPAAQNAGDARPVVASSTD
jgi:hypothetical protein